MRNRSEVASAVGQAQTAYPAGHAADDNRAPAAKAENPHAGPLHLSAENVRRREPISAATGRSHDLVTRSNGSAGGSSNGAAQLDYAQWGRTSITPEQNGRLYVSNGSRGLSIQEESPPDDPAQGSEATGGKGADLITRTDRWSLQEANLERRHSELLERIDRLELNLRKRDHVIESLLSLLELNCRWPSEDKAKET
jgi:hypothetical protein